MEAYGRLTMETGVNGRRGDLMKAELIVIESDADHEEAIARIEALIASTDASGIARLRAQAKLVEDYELRQWPCKVPSIYQVLAYLNDQLGGAFSSGAHTDPADHAQLEIRRRALIERLRGQIVIGEDLPSRGVMDWLSGLRIRAQARTDSQAQTDSADLIRDARDNRALITRLGGQTPVGQDLLTRDERYDGDQSGVSLPDALAHPASADIDFDPPPLELTINAHEPARRHWNYRLLRHGDDYLAIHEVYYNADGHPKSVTERPVGIVGDDVEEVRRVLEMMARSLGEPVLDYESF